MIKKGIEKIQGHKKVHKKLSKFWRLPDVVDERRRNPLVRIKHLLNGNYKWF